MTSKRLYSSLSSLSLGVIGAGQMGVGIAYVGAVTAKLPVTLMDASPEALKRGKKFMGICIQSNIIFRSFGEKRCSQREIERAGRTGSLGTRSIDTITRCF